MPSGMYDDEHFVADGTPEGDALGRRWSRYLNSLPADRRMHSLRNSTPNPDEFTGSELDVLTLPDEDKWCSWRPYDEGEGMLNFGQLVGGEPLPGVAHEDFWQCDYDTAVDIAWVLTGKKLEDKGECYATWTSSPE